MTRVLRTVCLFAVVFSVAGCAIFQPGAQQSSKEDKPLELTPIETETVVQVLWTTKVGRGMGKKSFELVPGILGDTVFAADGYGLVAAYDRFSGSAKWQKKVGSPARKNPFDLNDRSDNAFLSGGIGVGGGKAFVGTISGDFIALDAATGEEDWRVLLTSEILAPSTFGSDLVVVLTNDGKLVALEEENGEQRWIFTSQDPIVTLRGTSSPLVSGGVAYAGLASGLLTAVDTNSGGLVWDQRVSVPKGTSELERIVDVDGTPILTNTMVIAGGYQGVVRSMNRADGTVLWEAAVPTYHSLAEGLGLIFVVSDSDEVVGLDLTTGGEVWRQESFVRRQLTDPASYGNYVVVGDYQGYVHVIAASDGRIVGRARPSNNAFVGGFIESNGIFYGVDTGGKLTAFEIKLKT